MSSSGAVCGLPLEVYGTTAEYVRASHRFALEPSGRPIPVLNRTAVAPDPRRWCAEGAACLQANDEYAGGVVVSAGTPAARAAAEVLACATGRELVGA